MRLSRRSRLVTGVLLAALAAQALAAPLGSAATPARLGLTFEPFPPITPGSEVHVSGNLTYSFDAASANETTVALSLASGPAWLVAGLEPGSVKVPANTTEGKVVVPITLTLGVRQRTPALSQHTLQVLAEASANPPLEPATTSIGVVVATAFQGALRVEVPTDVHVQPGDSVDVGVRVLNEGNGPTRITLEGDAGPRGPQLVAPSAFIIEASEESRTVNVSFLAGTQGRYPVILRYASAYAFDGSVPGASGAVNLTIVVDAGRLLPGPGLGLVAPLVLASGVLARWTRPNLGPSPRPPR